MSNNQRQSSFASQEYANKGRITRREKFLGQMQSIVPWDSLVAVIEPHYPKGERGRPPIGCLRMLRIYFLQQWYTLADEALEDSLYDIASLREFVGIDLGCEPIPDATTLLKFRHLLEQNDLTAKMLQAINADLERRGLLMRAGTIVDATLIAAPSSTKNKSGQRDPDMHSTKKGNNHYFGMKAHIGVDAETGVVHSVTNTAAHVHDITQATALLHGQETDVYGDSGYRGIDKREEAQDLDVQWHTSMMPGKRKVIKQAKQQDGATGQLAQTIDQIEKLKASIRAKVEHPFHIVKNLFNYKKVSYKGIAKNAARHVMLFALANLVIVKKSLLSQEPCYVQKTVTTRKTQ
jgi:IS5 family transposase